MYNQQGLLSWGFPPKSSISRPHGPNCHPWSHDCDCDRWMSLIGCFNNSSKKSPLTWSCRFNTYERTLKGGEKTKCTKFILFDDDDNDWCMKKYNVTEEEFLSHVRWLSAQPILNVFTIYRRLTAAGWIPNFPWYNYRLKNYSKP